MLDYFLLCPSQIVRIQMVATGTAHLNFEVKILKIMIISYCSRTISHSDITSTYMTFHYQVTVTTVTDAPDDVAASPPVRVATHVPSEKRVCI